MRMLVTGGAGFIGSNFLIYMVNKYPNDMFICLDALTYAGNKDNLKQIKDNKNFKFIKGNICNKKIINRIFIKERIDYVVNFAAESHVTRSINEPDIFIKTNVFGTLNLLEASKKFNVKRFHQISTDEVYGSLPLKGKNDSFTELSQINPSTTYAASKASADMLVLSYYNTYNLRVTISRCSNNYGPRQHIEKFIPLVINNSLLNKKIPIHNCGEHIRDWIYVLDHVRAIDLIIHNNKIGQIYNIGGNCELSSLEVAKKILNILNKGETLLYNIPDRLGNDLRYSMNSKKIEKELKWKTETDFETGIQETINWYLKELGYEKI